MKILFIHSGTDLYGASRSLIRLSSRLKKDGHTIKVILPGNGPLVDELRSGGVDVVVEKKLVTITRGKSQGKFYLFKLPFQILFSTYRLYFMIRRFDPDIVHTMTAVIPAPGPAAILAGKPLFWHIRETFVEFPQLWKVYKHYIVAFSTRIICVSTPVVEQFGQVKSPEKLVILHNGFPKEEFCPVAAERIINFKEQYGIYDGQITVGVVGRIKFWRKGQEFFVEAARLLKGKYPDARFLCVGSPFPGNEEHLERLLDLIHTLELDGTVIYTGDVEDIKAAISSLDILVLPSAQPEPFGGVVIEAMAFAKPVIATKLGGSIEQVVDGKTGFLVEPANPQALAAAIGSLLKDRAKRVQFGINGYNRYLEKFEFENFYQKIIQLYHKSVRRRD